MCRVTFVVSCLVQTSCLISLRSFFPSRVISEPTHCRKAKMIKCRTQYYPFKNLPYCEQTLRIWQQQKKTGGRSETLPSVHHGSAGPMDRAWMTFACICTNCVCSTGALRQRTRFLLNQMTLPYSRGAMNSRRTLQCSKCSPWGGNSVKQVGGKPSAGSMCTPSFLLKSALS